MEPGQAHDLMARSIAPYFSKHLGINIQIENIPGGGQLIGLRNVLRRPADGYTLVTWSYPKLDVETVTPTDGTESFYKYEDFATIGSIMPEEHMLFAPAGSPFNSLQEIVDYAKEHPGELAFASSNPYPGVQGYLWEQLKILTGAEFEYVPYPGASPVITALLGNHADISSLGVGDIYELYVKTGKLKALSMARNRRNTAAPDVPSFEEAMGFPLPEWVGLANRAMMIRGDTDPEIIKIIVDAFKKASEEPQFREAYAKTGYTLTYMSPEEVDQTRKAIIEVAKELEAQQEKR
jgi:tripartite-type tricarboxylate transporter receptor subunit TctC